jgi:glycosyltransferase involved in cell wall biosynthesis
MGLPTVSVIIPTYNRPDALRSCLNALCSLDYPSTNLEVIVVDDGGDVPLEPVIESAHENLRVRLVRQENAGPAGARNAGAATATGELLAFTDDDCRPDPHWLNALVKRYLIQPESLVGGRTENALDNPFSRVSQQLVSYLYAYFNNRPGGARFFTSNNLALSAEAFREFGGFDTRFPLAAGEDREFCDRWLASGSPLVYAEEAVVQHEHHLSARSFVRQHFNYGRGAFFFHRSRSTRAEGGIAPEPIGFYGDLLRYPLRSDGRRRAYGDVLLIGLTQVVNAAGFFYEFGRSKLRAGVRRSA